MSDLEGYEPDDPKSPGWADRMRKGADEARRSRYEREVLGEWRDDDQRSLPRLGTLPHELEGDQ